MKKLTKDGFQKLTDENEIIQVDSNGIVEYYVERVTSEYVVVVKDGIKTAFVYDQLPNSDFYVVEENESVSDTDHPKLLINYHKKRIEDIGSFSDIEHRDPFGIENVNFSLISKNDSRWDKFKKERLDLGFDESETWSLDSTISNFIYPRLKYFYEYCMNDDDKKNNIGLAKDVNESSEVFDFLNKNNHGLISTEKQLEVNNRLKKFADIFLSLWW